MVILYWLWLQRITMFSPFRDWRYFRNTWGHPLVLVESLDFCVDRCPFVILPLAIVLTALLWPLYWLPFFGHCIDCPSLAIVLTALLQFTDSDYLFGIFKHTFIMCFIVIIPDLSAVCWVIWFNHLPRNNTKLFLKGKSLSSVTWTTEHIWLNGMQDLNLTNATIHIHLDINKVVLLCHD